MNLADIYEALADAIGERDALVFEDTTLTFAELDATSNKAAHALAAVGAEPGTHVAMHMRNSLEFLECLIGALKIRAVPVNINYRYTEAELTYLYTNSKSKVLVVDTEFTPLVAHVLADCPDLKAVLVIGDPVPELVAAGAACGVSVQRFADIYEPASDARDFRPRSIDDKFIVYTGGTTGNPKGVVWRQEDFFYAALSGGNQYGEPRESIKELTDAAVDFPPMTLLVTAPLMHGAASYAMFSMFFMGARQVLMRNFDHVDALKLVEREKIQIVMIVGDAMGVPLVDELTANPDKYDVSSLFSVANGGAIWSQASRQKLLKLLPNTFIRDSFGASESGADGTVTMDDEGVLRLPPSKHTTVVNERLDPIEPGSDEVGYLARLGHVPVEYLGDPVKSAETFPVKDGVRMSILGDMARVEADGSIVVLGRGSGCINTGGEKVFPEEVEQALKSHPAILDTLVAGAPDQKFGQAVAAVVQLREGFAEPTLAELKEHLRPLLAGYKAPRSLVVVEQIRRSPSGKADYRWAKDTVSR
ncbi:acyl-CoA synthetase [Tomitella biformata]|uniref:acyl-CoA synthetase n=1 Tax=Tomitella biformata TaxID=630403 RepID=UPI000463921B|nr:acyl-CoA synthetase [Tomitella biformata]